VGNYGGEAVNHAADLPGWNTNASVKEWDNCSSFAVDRLVTPESLQAVTSVETLPATAVAPCSNGTKGVIKGCYVVSFAHHFNGFLDVKSLPAAAGSAITFTYSANCKAPCGPKVAYMPCNPPTSGPGVCTAVATEWHAMDEMTAAAGAAGTSFHNKFNWHTFQFVTITGLISAPSLSSISGRRIMNGQRKIGTFRSSSAMLDKIYSGFANTYEGLTVSGMLVDCTSRERFGYEEKACSL
jgi:hypothetical protein